jgi:dihydrofolate reductase
MRKLRVYNSVSLDGYFTDANGDMSWAHKMDPEWQAFVAENVSGGGELLFGRVTYELMASYWPTPAAQSNPIIAERMNSLPKVVFSKTLDKAS